MIFTCNNESKYIQIETKDESSVGKFIDELQQADIINHLSQDLPQILTKITINLLKLFFLQKQNIYQLRSAISNTKNG